MNPQEISFDEWIKIGIEQGWCGPTVCYTHDGLPLSVKEEESLVKNSGCLLLLSLYR